MSAASLATSVPLMPIATPMSACFRAGASLTPSPVMATISPVALQRLDDAELVLGAMRAKTLCRRRAPSRCAGPSAPRAPAPVMTTAVGRVRPSCSAISRRRGRLVAGDHDGADAGRAAWRRPPCDLGSRRVDHADEPEQNVQIRGRVRAAEYSSVLARRPRPAPGIPPARYAQIALRPIPRVTRRPRPASRWRERPSSTASERPS